MRFKVSSTELLSRLQSISKVIGSKTPLPILDDFLFDLDGEGKLKVTASDVETRLVTSVEIMESEGSGLFAISAKILLDSLKELPEQPISFDINDNNLEVVICFQNGKYNFIGLNGDTYPEQKPMSENADTISIKSQTLISSISRSLFAIGEDELRPVMSGVLFDLQADGLTFVTSDGFKLVRLKNNTITSDRKASFIMPKKPAGLLKNLLSKDDEMVDVKFDENCAKVSCSNFEMVCRLIEGRYPNYNSVIPKDNPFKVVIDRESFLKALKRVSVFSQSNSLVKLHLRGEEMIITAQDIDFSTSAEEKVVCQYDGSELSIGFKATYLIEMLNNIGSDDVILALADASRAGLIIPAVNEEDEDLLMLLMPMMLNE